MNKNSIFSRSRFEKESSHYYFLDRGRVEDLKSNSSIVVTGARGTGKTTLLNALNWEEQICNGYLVDALGGKSFEDSCLGLYIKIPKIAIAKFSGWDAGQFEAIGAQLFSLYIDLAWLEQLMRSLGELSSSGEILVSGDDEQQVCQAVSFLSEAIFNQGEKERALGFFDLEVIFRNARKELERRVAYGEDVKNIHERFQASGQVGELGREVVRIVHSLWAMKGFTDFQVKVCMDECECLNDFQVKVLATMLRVASFPLFYVFSFIRLRHCFSSTLVNNLSLSKADYKHIALDEMSDSGFQKLAEGVVEVRLRAACGIGSGRVELRNVLGKIGVNHLIGLIVGRSEKQKAAKFMEDVQKASVEPYFTYFDESDLPYYQYYLVQALCLNTSVDELKSWGKAQRSQSSREIRKKMVAAYLSICNDYQAAPLYAGMDMVLQSSDKSIRDFLDQMDAVFLASNLSTEEFFGRTIPVDIQDAGLKAASEEKFKSTASAATSSPSAVSQLVYGLGRLTGLIQRQSSDNSHLKSSERGIFVISSALEEANGKVLTHIIEAGEAGFLRVLDVSPSKIEFRVNTSLAPYFRFSYRGAYYKVNIKLDDVARMMAAERKDVLDRLVDEIASRLDGGRNSFDGRGIQLGFSEI